MKEYKEHRFKRESHARKKAKTIHKKYGYTPIVFSVRNPKTNKRWFGVIEPKD